METLRIVVLFVSVFVCTVVADTTEELILVMKNKIEILEQKVRVLEIDNAKKTLRRDNDGRSSNIGNSFLKSINGTSETDTNGSNDELIMKPRYKGPDLTKYPYRRLLESPTLSSAGLVAFHTYLSQGITATLPGHYTFKFDVVPTNRGNGYSKHDGIFIAPRSGTYVFSWTLFVIAHSFAITEIVVDGKVNGAIVADSNVEGDWDFSCGVVVAEVNAGDHVYVRTVRSTKGTIGSSNDGRTAFSGWSIS